jgi:nucleoside phosphorylase
MIYICVAFKEEAKPLLAQWQFKRDRAAPCKVYLSDEIYLLITQMGQSSATEALETLLSYLPPKKDDIFINFGICAAPKEYEIGTVLECSDIYYGHHHLHLHSPSTCHLTTVDTPASSEEKTAVDMEAFGLFKIALHVFNRCYCIKVVSDHFKPLYVKEQNIATLLTGGGAKIKEIVNENSHCHRK